MKKHLALALVLAITLTFTACEEKTGGGGTFTDTRDGKKYKTIKIGEQVWMAENLNYETGKCYYNPDYCQNYGRLYDWETAMKACPSGWHLPSNAEWDKLFRYVDSTSGVESPYASKTAGKYLKAKNGWNKEGNGTDKFGFSAMPGGYGTSDGSFSDAGNYSFWWSNSEYNSGNAYSRYMSNGFEDANNNIGEKSNLFSVRCLQDYANYAEIEAEANEKAKAWAEAKAKAEAEEAEAYKAYIKANSGTFTDKRDKKKYKTIKINEQVWMAENLNYADKDSKCYDDKQYNCTNRLYDWETAMNSCPSGWHLPSNEEWDKLFRYVDGTSGTESPYESKTAGKYLKAMSGWKENGNGTDKFGFAALPGGWGNSSSIFNNIGGVGYWWSSSEYNNNNNSDSDRRNAYNMNIYYTNENTYYKNNNKYISFFSVRCLQDDANYAKALAEAKAEAEAYVKANGGKFTDTRDNKVYKTIKINEQVWMAENLNYADKNSKCSYDTHTANCKYGRLYDWVTAMNACPSGWHLPSNEEWDKLFRYVDGTNGTEPYKTAGKDLKAKRGWRCGGNGTDKFGFSAMPGGDGEVGNFGDDGYWWSDSEYNSDYAYSRYMVGDSNGVYYRSSPKSRSFTIRCLQGDADYEKVAKVEAEAKAAVEAYEAYIKVNGGTFTDTRDNKVYKTIKIGEQTWMAQNLNLDLPSSKCCYDEPARCKVYGRLYNWETAMKACPKGWHLPSNAEWDALVSFAGGKETAGKYLKAKKTALGNVWNDGGNGRDKFGFSAMPGGDGFPDGSFNPTPGSGYWWTATENGSTNAYYKAMSHHDLYNSEGVYDGNESKGYLYSVRCIQN